MVAKARCKDSTTEKNYVALQAKKQSVNDSVHFFGSLFPILENEHPKNYDAWGRKISELSQMVRIKANKWYTQIYYLMQWFSMFCLLLVYWPLQSSSLLVSLLILGDYYGFSGRAAEPQKVVFSTTEQIVQNPEHSEPWATKSFLAVPFLPKDQDNA